MDEPVNGRAPLRKARTRAAILDAATALFSDRGYDATSIHQVAARADTGVGTLYNYFDSKEEILRHVLIRQFDGAEAAFAQVSAARSSPSERLMLALDMYANYVRQNRRLLTSLFGVSLRSEGDIDGAWRERLLAAFVPLVREAMDPSAKEARDPDIAARLLLSTYTFAVLRIGLWRDIAVDDTALGNILHRIVADVIGPRAAVMR